MTEPRKLGQILVDLKVMQRLDVDRVLEALRRRPRPQKFGQMAKDMGLVREEQILAALAVQMKLLSGITRLNLRQILAILQRPNTPG
jgi:alkylated DNA nucleotide flippase Atl1